MTVLGRWWGVRLGAWVPVEASAPQLGCPILAQEQALFVTGRIPPVISFSYVNVTALTPQPWGEHNRTFWGLINKGCPFPRPLRMVVGEEETFADEAQGIGGGKGSPPVPTCCPKLG